MTREDYCAEDLSDNSDIDTCLKAFLAGNKYKYICRATLRSQRGIRLGILFRSKTCLCLVFDLFVWYLRFNLFKIVGIV